MFGKANLEERTIVQLVTAGRGAELTRKLATSGNLYAVSDEVLRRVACVFRGEGRRRW